MNNTYDSLHTAGYKWRLDSYALLCLANLELGLRWLNDRIEDDRRDQFGAFIKGCGTCFDALMGYEDRLHH